MTPDAIRDYADPEPEEWDATLTNLGVKLRHVTRSQGVAWAESYCALCWDNERAKPWVGAWVGISAPKKFGSLLYKEMLQAGTKEVSQQPFMVWVERTLHGETVSAFDETLEELLNRWIDSWKRLGGLKAVILRTGSASVGQGDTLESDEPA